MAAGESAAAVDPARVARSIAAHLANVYPAEDGAEGLRVVGPIVRQRGSLLFRADGPALPGALAVKVLLAGTPPAPDAEGAGQQFAALGRAAAAFAGHQAIGVATPRALIPEAGAFAMDWVDGEPLTASLRQRGSAARARERFALAGRWLATLHAAGPVATGPLDAQRKLAYLREAVPALRAHDSIARALALLTSACEEVAHESLPVSWAHGDFKPDNLLWTGVALIGIDVHLAGQTVVVADLASFLVHAAMDERRARWTLRPPAPPGWREAFVAGYFGTTRPPWRALAWLELYSVLRIWIEARAQPSGMLRSLARRRLFVATLEAMMRRWR